MRAALLLLAFAGCNRSAPTTEGVDAGADLGAGKCSYECRFNNDLGAFDPCDGGGICFPGGLIHAACLTPCRTTADCPAGLDCRVLEYVGNYLPSGSNSPVCVSHQLPAPCAPPNGFGCSDTEGLTRCLDDTRLGTGFVWPNNFICGYAVSECANGCVRFDAGFLPSDHCRQL